MLLNMLDASLDDAIRRAQEHLLRQQNHDDGYWSGELLADTTLESDAVMLWHFLGRRDSPKIPRLASQILSQQLPDGGWPIYKNGPAEISATVKAYWALKLAGMGPMDPPLARARRRISALGGIHRVNTYTKFYLALFGLYDWKGVPSIPPEMTLAPAWSPLSIYDMSSWTRAIVLPLAVVWAKRPLAACPPGARLDELFPDAERHVALERTMPPAPRLSWQSLFLKIDAFLKRAERWWPAALRERALRRTEALLLDGQAGSDGLGAIYPGILNCILALKALGYGDDHPALKAEIAAFESLELDRGERLQMQPCTSPVWDTAIAMTALAESGISPAHPSMVSAARWLVAKQIANGGWAFQFNNPHYPDVDDTAMVILGLSGARLSGEDERARRAAAARGLAWVLSMQNKDGGWGAFDKDNDKELLTKIPFADHNAMLDPSCEDITGRILEMLGRAGHRRTPAQRRAVHFLRSRQEPDGSWFGRWGVNYVYGTWLALRGLAWSGHHGDHDPAMKRGAAWLFSAQRADGGWGETCKTYHVPGLKANGPSTPSQTAWGLMGLMAAGHAHDPRVERGVQWLLDNQRADGGWDEREATGTGFPKVFYLEYTMYRDYFPLMALAQYAHANAHPELQTAEAVLE